MSAFIALSILLLFCACGQTVPEGAVMVVGERVLYPEDVMSTMQRVAGDTAAVRVMADNILARELFLQHAHDLGLDSIPGNQRVLYERRREILQNAYIGVLNSRITLDSAAFQAFRDSLPIMVEYSAFYSADSATIDLFMSRLEQGEDFNILVSELSIDAFVRETGGRTGPVPLVRTSREDYAVLRNLSPGEVGTPYLFRPGWRILKMDDLRMVETDAPALHDDELEMVFLSLSRESLRHRTQDSLASAVNLEINLEACSLLASRATSAGGDHEPYTPEEESIEAITWNGGSRSVVSLANNIIDLPGAIPRDARDPSWVANYAFWIGLYDVQTMVATSMGLDTLPQYASQIRRRQAEALLDMYYTEVLDSRIVMDEELLEQHYLAVSDTMTVPEARTFVHTAAQGDLQVQILNDLYHDGADPSQSAEMLTFIPQLSASQGSALTRPMDISEFPEAYRERVMELEPGEALICSLEAGFHVYFRLEEIIPAHRPLLEEIRSMLEPRVMAEVEIVVIAALVDSLKEVYHPYIDEEFFHSFNTPADSTAEASSTEERQEDGL
ncbi:MAG: hypothetical protein R6V62_02155 [Candidatus Fermentibacteraceae bacterium]